MKLSENPTIDAVLKVAGAIILYRTGKKFLQGQRTKNTEMQVTTHPEVGQAQALRSAMNPSGEPRLFSVDGTDEEAIFGIAKEIKDLNAVQLAYSNLYKGDSLLDDLKNELSTQDYEKFLGLATNGKAGNKNYGTKRDDIPANYAVLTKQNVFARKTAKKESHLFPGNNIIKIIPPGFLIGFTTGKFVYDGDNDVVFVEAWTLNTKKEKMYFYVAKSQVELISKTEKEKRDKSGKLHFAALGMVDALQQQIISISPAIIYDLRFQPVGKAGKNILLGFPVLSLDTGRGMWTQFETVQGMRRWVNSSYIKTIQR